jgi:hypothetical protein
MESTFYFQQSVEKTVKSLGLVMNIISENDLRREIGHNPVKIFDKIFRRLDLTIKQFEEQIHKYPELEIKFAPDLIRHRRDQEKLTNFFIKVYDTKTDTNDRITPRQRRKIKDGFRKIINELIDIDSEIQAFRRNKDYRKRVILDIEMANYRMWRNFFNKLIPKDKLRGHEKEYRTTLMKTAKLYCRLVSPLFYFELYYVMTALFYMSLITRDLAISSRYPMSDNDPIARYHKKTRMLDESIPIVKKTIDKTKWIIRYIERKEKQNRESIKNGPFKTDGPVSSVSSEAQLGSAG